MIEGIIISMMDKYYNEDDLFLQWLKMTKASRAIILNKILNHLKHAVQLDMRRNKRFFTCGAIARENNETDLLMRSRQNGIVRIHEIAPPLTAQSMFRYQLRRDRNFLYDAELSDLFYFFNSSIRLSAGNFVPNYKVNPTLPPKIEGIEAINQFRKTLDMVKSSQKDED